MVTTEIFHVVIDPPASLDTGLIKETAELLGKDPYEITLLLAKKFPRTVAHFRTRDEADSLTHKLSQLNYAAFTCNDADLQISGIPVFSARFIKPEPGGFAFISETGEEQHLKPDNVFLIIEGREIENREEEIPKSSMKLNLPATLATGGIPIWRHKIETKKSSFFDTEYFANFYDQDSPEPVVQIRQHHLDYSFLGQKLSFNSLINFKTLSADIKSTFPQTLLDDRLSVNPGLNLSSRREVESNCRLLFLRYRALKNRN